jgi:hypothetical protein
MAVANKPDRRQSPTPPQQPISKRDKRRGQLSERLSEITNSFQLNRDSHYRQQLHALQIDMTLIMGADPYANVPLDDSPESLTKMIAELTGKSQNGAVVATAAAAAAAAAAAGTRRPEADAAAMSGRWYAQFVEEINNAVEDRDGHMAMLHVSITFLTFCSFPVLWIDLFN